MNFGTSHISDKELALQGKIDNLQGQLADISDRLGAADTQLEKERLLREEMVRKMLEEERERIMREAREEAYAKVKEENETAERELRDREQRIAQAEAEQKEKVVLFEIQKKELESSVAARIKEVKANMQQEIQKAVNEFKQEFTASYKAMFDSFLKAMETLPGASPDKKAMIAETFAADADNAIEFAEKEAKKAVDRAIASDKKKVNQIGWLARSLFGQSSEKSKITPEERDGIIDEILHSKLVSPEDYKRMEDVLREHRRAEAEIKRREEEKKKSGHGHNPIPSTVPVASEKTLIPKVVEDNRELYTEIDKVITRKLRRITSYTQDIIIRIKFRLKNPAEHPDLPEFAIADLPEDGKWKSAYSEEIRTGTMVEKYVDHIPLARQEKRTERDGCHINRSSMSDMIDEDVDLWLRPLFPLLEHEVLSSPYLAADGVPMKVVDNEKKKTVSHYVTEIRDVISGAVIFKSWVNPPNPEGGKKKSGRSKDVLQHHLKDWHGRALMCDGYAGYDWLRDTGVDLCRCAAHPRREFDEAKKENPQKANEAIVLFQMPYRVEYHIKWALAEGEMTLDEVCSYRHTYAGPAWRLLKAWCVETLVSSPEGSQLRKACKYFLRYYDEIIRYMDIPWMPIDNNDTERQIRQLVMGRKNYLFNQTEESLNRDTIIYSFFATCIVNGKNPERWLNYVKANMADTTPDKMISLLPNHWEDTTTSILSK